METAQTQRRNVGEGLKFKIKIVSGKVSDKTSFRIFNQNEAIERLEVFGDKDKLKDDLTYACEFSPDVTISCDSGYAKHVHREKSENKNFKFFIRKNIFFFWKRIFGKNFSFFGLNNDKGPVQKNFRKKSKNHPH